MADIATVRQYVALTETLVNEMTKDEVAEVARVLAINIAQYSAKYGEFPLQEAVRLMQAETFDEQDLRMIASGMELLVTTLALSQKEFRPSNEA